MDKCFLPHCWSMTLKMHLFLRNHKMDKKKRSPLFMCTQNNFCKCHFKDSIIRLTNYRKIKRMLI